LDNHAYQLSNLVSPIFARFKRLHLGATRKDELTYRFAFFGESTAAFFWQA
jgi:hypothetical protein